MGRRRPRAPEGPLLPGAPRLRVLAEAEQGRAPVDARIINTSSGAGLQGSIGQSSYSAAKAGIATLTLVQAAELGRYGITSNAIAPSARTRMTEDVFADMMEARERLRRHGARERLPAGGVAGQRRVARRDRQVFELAGGEHQRGRRLAHRAPRSTRARAGSPTRWGGAVHDLLKKAVPAQKVYGT